MTGSEQFWRAIVTGEAGAMLRERRRHRRIPGAPRCKTCLVPLGGPAAPMIRLVLNRRPSAKNPNYCDVCETFVRTHPGGAEVEISMLFADVRGSTALAERMRPTEFSRLMNRFFERANRVVIDSDGVVDKLVGDEVVALYVPAVGPHARKAVEAAGDLLRATAALVPVGAGVHTGVAYVGAVGSDSTVADFTARVDAALRFTNNDIAVANLRVAVTQRIQQDGQWRDGDRSSGRERQAERGGDFSEPPPF